MILQIAMATRRLGVAFALAPLGVTSVVAAIMLVDGHMSGTWLMALAGLTGLGYIAGAVLLPLFFGLERLGKRGWRYYVPTAAVAGIGMAALMAWPEPISRPWGFYIIFGATGALCGGVFSVALVWRPDTPRQPEGG